MIQEWVLNVIMVFVGISGGGAFWYFLSQKQLHHALWSAVFTLVLLIIAVGLHLRNAIILKDTNQALIPKLEISIAPDDFPTPSLTEYKYPLQEYTLNITNNNLDSVPVDNLTIEFLLPYIVTKVRGKTYEYSGGPVWVRGMRKVEVKNGKVIRTEEEPAESLTAKLVHLSVQQWKENDQLVNSHIVVFSCEKFPSKTDFTGSIVVDLTKEPTGMIKTPDEIGKYVGSYDYRIKAEKFPTVKINGVIPKPNIKVKLAEHHFDQGSKLIEQGEYVRAVSEFREATDLNPKHAKAFFLWGMALAYSRDLVGAAEKFEITTTIDPKNADAFFKWGQVLWELKDYERAAEKFKKVTEIDPKNARAFFWWGKAREDLEDYEGAAEKYEKATEINTRYARAYFQWGYMLCKLGRCSDAIEKYRMALKINPKYVAAHFRLALLLSQVGDSKGAIESYNQVIELEPEGELSKKAKAAIRELEEQSE